jgi:hypothetical protein
MPVVSKAVSGLKDIRLCFLIIYMLALRTNFNFKAQFYTKIRPPSFVGPEHSLSDTNDQHMQRTQVQIWRAFTWLQERGQKAVLDEVKWVAFTTTNSVAASLLSLTAQLKLSSKEVTTADKVLSYSRVSHPSPNKVLVIWNNWAKVRLQPVCKTQQNIFLIKSPVVCLGSFLIFVTV